MTAAVGFLQGAGGRLLPVSVPFRYFGAAVAYHVLGWLALLAGAHDVPRFAGGLGWPLAALHLLTLGVLVMLALGASLQLLPVATRRPVASARLPALVWWLYTPGVAVLALGMGLASRPLLAAGGAAVGLALSVFAVLLALNLVSARGMPTVVAHGWTSLVSLVVAVTSAASLVGGYLGWPLLAHTDARALHVVFAAYGFMGMLAVGLSYIVIPMFALGAAPTERRGLVSCALAIAALLLAGAAPWSAHAAALRTAACAGGALALTLHVHAMHMTIRSGMRRSLGRSFMLVRLAWGCLAASVVAALGLAWDAPVDGLATLFGLALVAGWLLTFSLGILQRIVPFLASMHAARGRRPPPTPSMLTATAPLAFHFHAHVVALAALAAAVALDSARWAGAGAALGLLGALAFAAFFATSLGRMARAGAPPA